GNRVLEAGCGIGNFTETLLDRQRLVSIDGDPLYVEVLNWRFGHLENVRTAKLDPCDPAVYASLAPERLDTIVCLNVLEHVQEDEPLLRAQYDVLEPGGHVIVLVPAHPWLFGPADETLGHVRRYTQTDLHTKLQSAGFEVMCVEEFNRLGAWGWWIDKALGRRHISRHQVRVFEMLLPFAKGVEAMKLGRGLGLIAVGRKR